MTSGTDTAPGAGEETRPVLILNTGSSTFKWALLSDDERFVGTGVEEWAGPDSLTRKTQIAAKLHSLPPCRAVGHRMVHGGTVFCDSIVVDDDVRRELEELLSLDPIHMRPALCALDAARDAFPDVPHVAAFDTAFHRTMNEAMRGYALPAEWVQRWGLRRFGFHGLSVSWSVEWVRKNVNPFPRRMIVAHLGSGCSITAVLEGRSIDNSMGFTPLEGLMMATRSGSVDAGLLFHLQARHSLPVDEIEDVLTHRSGVLGVSGVAADIRQVIKAADAGNARARLALEMFVVYARRHAGAAAAVMGGVDAIVFTGGVGEHQPGIRKEICGAFQGVRIDDAANERVSDGVISAADSAVKVMVVRAREDLVLLRETCRLAPEKSLSGEPTRASQR
jgi:acetate kinase